MNNVLGVKEKTLDITRSAGSRPVPEEKVTALGKTDTKTCGEKVNPVLTLVYPMNTDSVLLRALTCWMVT